MKKTYEELEDQNKKLRDLLQGLLDQLFQLDQEKIKLEELVKYGPTFIKN